MERLIKRSLDIVFSVIGLSISSPIFLFFGIAIWLQDRHSPFYFSMRIGRCGKPFMMIKLRSMTIDADKTGIVSTSNKDPRITPLGHFIRAYKLDELTQLWNILKGDMSFVGPRPNVKLGTDLYTNIEKRLLEVNPGMTDFASIVFSDEGKILETSNNPNQDYDRIIRPWKSRLSLFYIEHASTKIDVCIIFLTLIYVFSRKTALRGIQRVLKRLGADEDLIQISGREIELFPCDPPGMNVSIVNKL